MPRPSALQHPGGMPSPRCRRRGARRGGLRLLCQFFFVVFCFLFVFLFLSLLLLFFLFFIFLFLAAPGHLLLLLQNKGRKRKQTSAAGQIKLSTWAKLNKHGQTMPGGQRPRGKSSAPPRGARLRDRVQPGAESITGRSRGFGINHGSRALGPTKGSGTALLRSLLAVWVMTHMGDAPRLSDTDAEPFFPVLCVHQQPDAATGAGTDHGVLPGGGRDVPVRIFLGFVSTAAGRRMLGRPGSPDLPSLWRPANERNFIEE